MVCQQLFFLFLCFACLFSHRPFVFGIMLLVPCNPPMVSVSSRGLPVVRVGNHVPSRESLGFSWGPSSLGRKG